MTSHSHAASTIAALDGFHPLVREWFASQFEAPTGAQGEGWQAIAEGRHTLIAAPTGSGKTLAAFLTCIDRLVRAGLDGGLPERTEVVYVSPLKALSNDVQRNLSVPLEAIAGLAEAHGTPLPEIRVAVRTGDTPQRERTLMAKQPPHILITTPESLFILLTSESGRRGLRGVRTLILDEIHAVADDKRGSHLSLSVERLCKLADGAVTRIGLSATQRPIAEVARFLVGTAALRQAQGERSVWEAKVEVPASAGTTEWGAGTSDGGAGTRDGGAAQGGPSTGSGRTDVEVPASAGTTDWRAETKRQDGGATTRVAPTGPPHCASGFPPARERRDGGSPSTSSGRTGGGGRRAGLHRYRHRARAGDGHGVGDAAGGAGAHRDARAVGEHAGPGGRAGAGAHDHAGVHEHSAAG